MQAVSRMLAVLVGAGLASVQASTFTPNTWQQVVERHAVAALVGQKKHTTWIRDKNKDFIDDLITERYRPGELVDVIVDLNSCMKPEEIQRLLGRFGRISYIAKLVSAVWLDRVRFDDLHALAWLPEVAMVEWQEPTKVMNDISSRAVQSRASVTYSPNTAQDSGFNGAGVNIAIVDTGVDENHETFVGKWVAGFDATNAADPGDGSTHPGDGFGHGTHVAGIALGAGAAGRTCRTPNDGSTPTTCAGVAAGAGLVVIRVCDSFGSCPPATVAKGLDWLGLNAAKFHIRVGNMSLGYCTDDDGMSAMAQQVNYVVALGVTMAVAHGNASNCGLVPGTVRTMFPGSSSFAITVGGTDDRGTVTRTDDTSFSQFLRGPRLDFTLATPNLLALKPDISAPGEGIFSAQAGSTSGYVSKTGTSMATPQVAGAAAVVIQARPSIDPGSLKDLLKRSADSTHNAPQFPAVDPVWDRALGEGMLNVFPAVTAAAQTDVKFPSCVGPPATPGGLCTLVAPLPPWDNTNDISTATSPKVGVANTITAQVRNNGAGSATVNVNFGVYVFAAGNNQFFHVGTQRVTIPPNTTVGVNQAWTPQASNHQCVQVTIDYAFDTDYTNNVTQRNLQVAPSRFEMLVENPFMEPADFRLEAKSDREGWTCRVSEEKFTLDPFKECPRTVRIEFKAPAGTKAGEAANCNVGVYGRPRGADQRERLIGGVTARTFVPAPCALVGTLHTENGQPVNRARVTFTRLPSEEHTPPPGPDKQNATTGRDGVFSVELTPYFTYEVVVHAPGMKPASTKLEPNCEGCTLNLVIGEKGLQATQK